MCFPDACGKTWNVNGVLNKSLVSSSSAPTLFWNFSSFSVSTWVADYKATLSSQENQRSLLLPDLLCFKCPMCTGHLWHHTDKLNASSNGGSFECLEVRESGFVPVSVPLCLSLFLSSPSFSLFFEMRTCLWSYTYDKVSAWCFPFMTTLLWSSELEAVTQERRNNTQGCDINSLWS